MTVAGPGPAPKDPATRRRRNVDPIPITEISTDGQLCGPELPDGVLPDGETWHARTLAWWDTWRRSEQSRSFLATDWDFLIDTALMHHTMWTRARWEFAGELRLRAGKFGATPEDRMRLRMRVTDTGPASKPAEPAAPSRYGHLRSA
jgi:hypothetical protein